MIYLLLMLLKRAYIMKGVQFTVINVKNSSNSYIVLGEIYIDKKL